MLWLQSAVLCLGYVEHCRWCGLAHWALLDGVSRYCDIQRNLLHRCYQALSPAAWQQARSHNVVLRMQRTQRRCTIADAGLLLRSCQSNLSPTPHLLLPLPPQCGVGCWKIGSMSLAHVYDTFLCFGQSYISMPRIKANFEL